MHKIIVFLIVLTLEGKICQKSIVSKRKDLFILRFLCFLNLTKKNVLKFSDHFARSLSIFVGWNIRREKRGTDTPYIRAARTQLVRSSRLIHARN